jgi:hypothetical protein
MLPKQPDTRIEALMDLEQRSVPGDYKVGFKVVAIRFNIG